MTVSVDLPGRRESMSKNGRIDMSEATQIL